MLSKIKSRYRDKAREAGSLFLLESDDAIRFIEECLSSGLHLEGIEGFRITEGGAYQPCQEHSNDIAETNLNDNAFVQETKKFILERKGIGIWFEVVFSEPID